MIRPGLHPPLPAVRVNNNLLLWSRVFDPSRDRVNSFSSTLRRRRNMGELNGWAGAAFLRMASLRCETKDPNKDERPCQFFRCNTGHASRIAMSRVVPCEHVRPQTVSADDTVVGYSEQTPMEAPLGNLKAYFMIQFPARTAWASFPAQPIEPAIRRHGARRQRRAMKGSISPTRHAWNVQTVSIAIVYARQSSLRVCQTPSDNLYDQERSSPLSILKAPPKEPKTVTVQARVEEGKDSARALR